MNVEQLKNLLEYTRTCNYQGYRKVLLHIISQLINEQEKLE